jgi:hypothetical protein
VCKRFESRITVQIDVMVKNPSPKDKSPTGPDPKGPTNPYPVDEPIDPHGPGSEPDVLPGKPDNPMPRY